MVYWTDITGPSISKASLEGGEIIPLVSSRELQLSYILLEWNPVSLLHWLTVWLHGMNYLASRYHIYLVSCRLRFYTLFCIIRSLSTSFVFNFCMQSWRVRRVLRSTTLHVWCSGLTPCRTGSRWPGWMGATAGFCSTLTWSTLDPSLQIRPMGVFQNNVVNLML